MNASINWNTMLAYVQSTFLCSIYIPYRTRYRYNRNVRLFFSYISRGKSYFSILKTLDSSFFLAMCIFNCSIVCNFPLLTHLSNRTNLRKVQSEMSNYKENQQIIKKTLQISYRVESSPLRII